AKPSPACSNWPAPARSTTSSSTSWTRWSTRACWKPTSATTTAWAAAASRSPDRSGHRRQQPRDEGPDHARLHDHREQHAIAGAPEVGAVVDVVTAAPVHPDRIADVEHGV